MFLGRLIDKMKRKGYVENKYADNFFSKLIYYLKEFKSLLTKQTKQKYVVPYRYLFILLIFFISLLHLYFLFGYLYTHCFLNKIKGSVLYFILKVLVMFVLILIIEIYSFGVWRDTDDDYRVFLWVYFHKWGLVVRKLDIIIHCVVNYFLKHFLMYTVGIRYVIKVSFIVFLINSIIYYIKVIYHFYIKYYYRYAVFIFGYRYGVLSILKLFYFLEKTYIKVLVVDILNLFGLKLPRYALPTSFYNYWEIPGLSFYFIKFLSFFFLKFFLLLKWLLTYPFYHAVLLALTPSEVAQRRYLLVDDFNDSPFFNKGHLLKKYLQDPKFKSKFFFEIYDISKVELSNFTTVFYNITHDNVKRMFQRCMLILGIKYNAFPFNLNFILPFVFYKFYMPFIFYTRIDNFKTNKECFFFFYELVFNKFKFNTSRWYINLRFKLNQHFFKFEKFRDQLFFYTTYKAKGQSVRDYSRDEFSTEFGALGFDEHQMRQWGSEAERQNFESIYRGFLPREIVYMADLDYLFPDIGSYNKVTIVREAFFRAFLLDVKRLRSDINSPYRAMILRYTRNHWLKMSHYQEMCQDDVRDYFQKLELDLLHSANLAYKKKKITLPVNWRSISSIYWGFLNNFLGYFVNNFFLFFKVLESEILKKFNINFFVVNDNFKFLNVILTKQYTNDIYKRILIYEFLLKREGALMQKMLSKPIFDRLVSEDQVYADAFKAYCHSLDADYSTLVFWCKNYYEYFIDEYQRQAREKLRNSFLAIISAYLSRRKVVLFNFSLNDFFSYEGKSFYRLFDHKLKSFGLLINFNLIDILRLLKYFYKGIFLLFYLRIFYKNEVFYLQFKEVFFYDILLFIFLVPRYILNIFVYLLSKLRLLFNICIIIYSFFFGLYAMLLEGRTEYYGNMLMYPYFYWHSNKIDLEYPFLPAHHEKWCLEHGITFDIYYNVLALPTVVIWFVIAMYHFMYNKFLMLFPLNAYESFKDGLGATDEDERLMEGGVFRRIFEDRSNSQEIEDFFRYEFIRKSHAAQKEEDKYYDNIFQPRVHDNFAVIDNKSLFKEEFETLISPKDEDEIYKLYDKGLLGITRKEFKYYESEETFHWVFEDAWILQNDLDPEEFFKRNYGEYFYNKPRELSQQVQERFSVLYSQTQKYENLLSFEVNSPTEEYKFYMDILYVYQNSNKNLEYLTVNVAENLKAWKTVYNKTHDSVNYS